jgi:hypothetical protein
MKRLLIIFLPIILILVVAAYGYFTFQDQPAMPIILTWIAGVPVIFWVVVVLGLLLLIFWLPIISIIKVFTSNGDQL